MAYGPINTYNFFESPHQNQCPHLKIKHPLILIQPSVLHFLCFHLIVSTSVNFSKISCVSLSRINQIDPEFTVHAQVPWKLAGFFFYQNDIHVFTNNIYNVKTIKIKETLKKPSNIKTVPP